MHRLDGPAAVDEASGQVVEQFGMVGGSPRVPKSLGVLTRPAPKWCCQMRLTMTRAVRWDRGPGEPVRELQPAAGLLRRRDGLAAEDLEEAPRHDFAGAVRIAAFVERDVVRLPLDDGVGLAGQRLRLAGSSFPGRQRAGPCRAAFSSSRSRGRGSACCRRCRTGRSSRCALIGSYL